MAADPSERLDSTILAESEAVPSPEPEPGTDEELGREGVGDADDRAEGDGGGEPAADPGDAAVFDGGFESEGDFEIEEDFEVDDEDGEPTDNEGFAAALEQAAVAEPTPSSEGDEAGEAVASDATAEGERLDDGIDLRADQRSAIEVAYKDVEAKTLYEVLLLPRTADARSIKRAYYRLSKEYHPDKFYRKNIGSYKEKLEIIFNRVSDAYRTLSDDALRRDYDTQIFGKDRSESGQGSEASTTVDFVPEALRKRRVTRTSSGKAPAKPKKKAPPPVFIQKLQGQLAERIQKSRKHMEEGRRALDQKRFADAASNFQLAGTLDPRNREAKTLFKRAQSEHRNRKAEEFFVQGQEALLAEDTKRAAQFFQQAVDCKPTKGKYYSEFGKLITVNTLQQRVGLELLKKAVEAEPRSVEYTLDLAHAYAELAMPSNAVRAFERVLHLDPKNSVAAKALKRLK